MRSIKRQMPLQETNGEEIPRNSGSGGLLDVILSIRNRMMIEEEPEP